MASTGRGRSAGGRGKRGGKRAPRAAYLESLFGVPLGDTLEGLAGLGILGDHLWVFDKKDRDEEVQGWVARLEDALGVTFIGRAANGYFGPLRSGMTPTVDAAPVIYADRQGLDPEAVGRNLSEFLSVWCFVPDFFQLRGEDASSLEEGHREYFDGDPDRRAEVDRVLKLPGVRALTRGAEVMKLVEGLPEPARRRLDDADDLEESAQELLEAEVGTSKLVLDLEYVELEGDTATVTFCITCPDRARERVAAHPIVRGPVDRVMARLRAAHPGLTFVEDFLFVPTEADRFAIALRHAGAADLLAAFGPND